MNIVIFLITLGMIGWAVSRHMQNKGKNPILWFFIGAVVALSGIILLSLIPLYLLLILLGAYLYYYNYSEPLPKKKSDPNTIEVKAERIDPQAKFNQHEWFYLDDSNIQQGPISFHELKLLYNEQKIHQKSFVWNETMKEWKRIEDLVDLQSVL